MTGSTLILLALLIPLVTGLLIPLAHRAPNVREGITLVGAVALFIVVATLVSLVAGGERPEFGSFEVLPGLEIGFAIEPLGMLFAGVAGTLWSINSVYSIGYMRGHHEPRQTSFYVCFAVAIFAAVGVAFSANLFTLFLFYELLTLSTYPLVTHKGNDEAMRAGRVYLGILIGTSMVFLLPAIIWTGVLAGSLDFVEGGLLAGAGLSPTLLGILLGLYAFGIGKAALMPFHYWLPSAMVAPTPVSALLHAVAVVKAGVFSVLKVAVYVFGIDTLRESGASDWLVYVACFTLLGASIVALTKDNLKARLAYSTVSQLSYIVCAAALATSTAAVGGGLHIVMHAVGKITLFFCAGAIMVGAHKTQISEMAGIGRRMPFTMTAFLIGSLSIIGLPPLGGVWSKWEIGVGAVESGHLIVVAVLMISSLLNVAYLLPIVARAFFLPPPPDDHHGEDGHGHHGGGIHEAPMACVVPLCITAGLCVVLFFMAGPIEGFLSGMVADPAAAVPTGIAPGVDAAGGADVTQ